MHYYKDYKFAASWLERKGIKKTQEKILIYSGIFNF